MVRKLMTAMGACAVVVGLALVLGACGDSNLFGSSTGDDSNQARMEKGLAALDAQQWDEAIAIFQDMDDSERVRRYLASAYVGKAGLDVLTLVSDFADDASSDTASMVYDSVTAMLDQDGSGVISEEDLAAKIELVEQALAVLTPELAIAVGRTAARANGADVTGLTDNEIFQTGLYAAIHAVLGIVEQLRVPDNGELILTVDVLRQYPTAIDAVLLPATFNRDLDWVERAKVVLVSDFSSDMTDVSGNDIAEEFDKFLYALGYYKASDGQMSLEDRDVTVDELQAYLESL